MGYRRRSSARRMVAVAALRAYTAAADEPPTDAYTDLRIYGYTDLRTDRQGRAAGYNSRFLTLLFSQFTAYNKGVRQHG